MYNQIINDIHQFYELWKPLEASLCIDCEIVNNTNKEIDSLNEKYDKLLDKSIEKDEQIRELANIIKGLGDFIREDFERLSEDILFDYRDKSEKINFEKQYKSLDSLIKRIDNLGKK
ncbi:hypothetical protein ES705_42090 [subsurface metagenome]